VWGARTLAGADAAAPEWKYVAIRRLALFIERSIEKGIAWAVFEPNDEPLWIRLRRDIEDFLMNLFQHGAFTGRKPEEAFFVRCDRSTTTDADIDGDRVNVLVGFAATKPAEFVTIGIEQRAGTR
jgi:phage tail sheath protein FI